MYSVNFTPDQQGAAAQPFRTEVKFFTDQHGHFEVAGLPAGKGTFDRVFDSYPDKMELPVPASIDLPAKKPITLKLAHTPQTTNDAGKVTGTVTDTAGKPAVGLKLSFRNEYQGWFRTATTDWHGHFEFTKIPSGSGFLTLAADEQPAYPGEWLENLWMVVQIPAQEPLAVTITHSPLHTVGGRVLDARQHPLAGVTISYSMPDERRGRKTRTTVTGADGRYQVGKVAPGEHVYLLSLEKAGYRQRITGTLTNDEKDAIGDALMAACTATVQGTVCDGDGKPVHGATVVSVEGGASNRAVTDAAGAFTLTEQPEGELHLVAATPDGGGLTTCADNATNVRITCIPGMRANPHDLASARQMLKADSKLPVAQRRINHAETIREMSDIDPEPARRLAASREEPLSDSVRAYLLAKQAEQHPDSIGELITQLHRFTDPNWKLYAATELGIAAVKTDPALAEQLYALAKPLYDRASHNLYDGFDNFTGCRGSHDITLGTFALAGLLRKQTDVEAILAQVNQWAKEPSGTSWCIVNSLFEAAGRVSPELVSTVYRGIDSSAKQNWVESAIAALAPRHPEAVRQLMVSIHGEYGDPLPIIKALGTLDPAAALALAKSSPDHLQPTLLLTAAAFQPKAQAAAIVAEVFSEEGNRTIFNLAKVQSFNPELAKTLYLQHKTALEAASYHLDNCHNWDDSSTMSRVLYAYLLSGIDPREARLILETEYANESIKVRHGGYLRDLEYFPTAMCALDLRRAREMSETLNDNLYAEQPIISYLLASREARVAVENITRPLALHSTAEAHPMSGRVVDAAQHPLAGVTASFHVSANGDTQTVTASTGADGRYQLARVPVYGNVELLSLEKAGYRRHGTDNLQLCRPGHLRRCGDGGVHRHRAWHGSRCRRQTGRRRDGGQYGRRHAHPCRHGYSGRLHADRAAGRRTASARRHSHRQRADDQ